MIVLGLTGSIGMGKSTVAAMFREMGIPVFDADAEVHGLYTKGGAAVAPVAARFPKAVHDGAVDRAALSACVLGDKDALAELEAIVHPLVQEAEERFLEAACAEGARLAVLEIQLLFEVGAQHRVDAIAVVSAPEDMQRERVLARPGMTSEKLDAILARQLPDAEKRRRADFVIDTGTSLEATREEVERVIATLLGRADSCDKERDARDRA